MSHQDSWQDKARANTKFRSVQRYHSDFTSAWSEVQSVLEQVKVPTILGIFDVKSRYRRTSLGPLWLVINTLISIATLGVIYSQVFGFGIDQYVPYIAIGLVVWGLVASVLTESAIVLPLNSPQLKNTPTSILVPILRLLVRSLVIFAHNFVVVICIVAVTTSAVWSQFAALLGLFLVVANLLWVAVVISLIGARYRDVHEIILSFINLIFLATPIIWKHEMLGNYGLYAELNPLYHLLVVVRDPLLGKSVPMVSWIVVLGLLAVGGVIAALLFARYRRKVVLWL